MELTRKILLLFLPAIFIPHYGLCSEKLSSTSNDTTPTYSAEITRSFPRSREVFTQGLLYMDESLLEGTGLYGQSALRRVNIQTGFIEQQVALADRYFGEGITLSNNMIIQLTWKAGIGFVYDKSSFSLLHTFEYPGEGWGITRN
ncbi:MAG: glutaminyl-peptide cyclotransferase, partial [Thermodesulfobacteriota bacterium]|nr:glutaminyl-peptide cyclotransferase [Thermodesulfobacteriota bacterium]